MIKQFRYIHIHYDRFCDIWKRRSAPHHLWSYIGLRKWSIPECKLWAHRFLLLALLQLGRYEVCDINTLCHLVHSSEQQLVDLSISKRSYARRSNEYP